LRGLLVLTVIFLLTSLSFSQYEKVEDHPAVKRYQGSTLVDYTKEKFVEFYLPLGDVSGFD